MANLSYFDKRSLEKFLQMGSGYVLDFTNRTFEEFVFDSTGRNIYDPPYEPGISKANRLRSFWKNEPDHVVGKLLMDLIKGYGDESPLAVECRKIAERLLHGAMVEDAEVLSIVSAHESFDILVKSVQEAIAKNEPETGLDRLHTFTIKFVRSLCEKHGIPVDRDKPLHSVYGEYAKWLKTHGHFESVMTERILRSSISVMEAFNEVRNNQSLAHDNPILNRAESLLIFNSITSAIRFIWTLEDGIESAKATQLTDEDIPF